MPDDPLKKVVKGNGDKRRQQLVIGGTLALVLIAYLTYRKMGKGGGAAASGAPAGVTTATNVPSGTPAPDTTVPFAAPADTTGGGTVQTGSSTNAPGAPSSTQAQGTPSTPPVKAPPALADRAKTDPPIPHAPPCQTRWYPPTRWVRLMPVCRGHRIISLWPLLFIRSLRRVGSPHDVCAYGQNHPLRG